MLGTNRFGSGTIVGDGLVVTVSYVVVGAARVRVTDIEGHTSTGELVAHDFATGIAVVRADTAANFPIAAGDSRRIEVGQDAFVLASVGGDERRCATGVLTSVDPFDAYWEYRLERALWLSCPTQASAVVPCATLPESWWESCRSTSLPSAVQAYRFRRSAITSSPTSCFATGAAPRGCAERGWGCFAKPFRTVW